MKLRNINDVLALILIFLIPGMWVLSKWILLPGEVMGLLGAGWLMILQYYFRKQPPEVIK